MWNQSRECSFLLLFGFLPLPHSAGVISGAKLTVSDHMTMWGSGEKEIDGANVFAAREYVWFV